MTKRSTGLRAIVFDCFGVLTADKWHEFRLGLPKEQQGEASDLNGAYARGFITKDEFLTHVSELTGHAREHIAGLLDGERAKNTKLLRYIAQLKQRQYKIGLLSNVATPWITDYFLSPEEQALFDAMVFSFQVGMTKPDQRIFKLVCERLNVEPSAAVMIDDIARYGDAARATGMQAITYKDFAQTKHELEEIL